MNGNMSGIPGKPIEIIDTEGLMDGEIANRRAPTDSVKPSFFGRIGDYLLRLIDDTEGIGARSDAPCGGIMLAPSDREPSLDMTDKTLEIGNPDIKIGRVLTQTRRGQTEFVRCDRITRRCRCSLTHMFSSVTGEREDLAMKSECLRKKIIEETGQDPVQSQALNPTEVEKD